MASSTPLLLPLFLSAASSIFEPELESSILRPLPCSGFQSLLPLFRVTRSTTNNTRSVRSGGSVSVKGVVGFVPGILFGKSIAIRGMRLDPSPLVETLVLRISTVSAAALNGKPRSYTPLPSVQSQISQGSRLSPESLAFSPIFMFPVSPARDISTSPSPLQLLIYQEPIPVDELDRYADSDLSDIATSCRTFGFNKVLGLLWSIIFDSLFTPDRSGQSLMSKAAEFLGGGTPQSKC